jgi:two-component system sensor histidine kinase MprB
VDDRPLIFERFYRAPAARSMPGAGLGLSIVREVAEAHGGTVVAENADGGGARFCLSLNGAVRS